MKAPLNHFLWPKVSINFSSLFGLCTSEKLEKELHEMFPSGFPVVCSSGRVALYIAISETNYDRTKKFKSKLISLKRDLILFFLKSNPGDLKKKKLEIS